MTLRCAFAHDYTSCGPTGKTGPIHGVPIVLHKGILKDVLDEEQSMAALLSEACIDDASVEHVSRAPKRRRKKRQCTERTPMRRAERSGTRQSIRSRRPPSREADYVTGEDLDWLE